MDIEHLLTESRPFLEWVVNWRNNLSTASLDEIVGDRPERVMILSEDLVKGFCTVGPLSSPRVAAIVAPAVALFEAAYARGVRHFILAQDAHPEDSVEFDQYGPHCVIGSEEAETVDEIASLPFFGEMSIFPKNSVDSAIDTDLPEWLEAHPEITRFIVVGDCTDICTYQSAMYLRVRENALQRYESRVIVPVNAVDTYDLPVAIAEEIGATPHDGEILHLIFLYHMMLNGIEVVEAIR
jgi:nicotinamidase-related amidase